MNIVSGIRSYIIENEFKMTILNDKIDILNYIDIGHFDTNKIIVKLENKNIIINGNNLVISKLTNDEVLIVGDYKNIEFR